jgi:hypothetical protein
MFSILKYVVLFFLKHSNFMVFRCNSRRNRANRQIKTSEDLWRPWKDERSEIQEASEDVTNGGIMFPSSKTSDMEAKTQKDKEIGVMGTRHHSHALGTQFCAARHMRRRLTHGCRRLAPKTSVTYVGCMVLGTLCRFLEGQGAVLWLLGGKSPVF